MAYSSARGQRGFGGALPPNCRTSRDPRLRATDQSLAVVPDPGRDGQVADGSETELLSVVPICDQVFRLCQPDDKSRKRGQRTARAIGSV